MSELEELRAENAELKATLKYIKQRCEFKMKPHLSYGPQRAYDRVDYALSRPDIGGALKIQEKLRDTLHKICTYSDEGKRPSQEKMIEMALEALSYKPED